MIGIYKITNPNNRIYIGQSTNIETRWKSYKLLNCKGQVSLYNSLLKYGPENHIFEVIEECSVEQLEEREIYWGEFYKVLSNEHLNNKLGHGKGSYDSEETKLKKSLIRKGKSNYWLVGKEFTKDHCEKISKAKKGSKQNRIKIRKDKGISKRIHVEAIIKAKSIKIYQLNKNNELINSYQSASEAARILGLNQPNIHSSLDKPNRTYKGYKWVTKLNQI